MPAPADPTRWPDVKRVFERVVDLPPAARAAALDTACRTADGAPDLDLRAAVERLLTADARADADPASGFLAAPTLALGGLLDGLGIDPAEAPPHAEPGTRVGPYRIVALLGRGGMGDVYLAERADGLFERTVALKRVRADLAPVAAARFATERQILADLVHPNIARLYAAGADDDGRPWLAMEPVEGQPLPAHARGLGVHERVGLMIQVCHAVQHAHQRLVVHRDLKPSNVLVTADGRVVLLDFGIAQMLGAGPERQRLLTRAYAAPEQLRGDAATTASDVYGLGALLVETLTGERPVGPGATAGLGGDLGAVARRALAADPADRYASAAALADDLDRWCQGLPVRALPATLGYRARRFVGRHRAAVAAGALAVALVLAAAGVAATRITAERDLARAAAADAEAVAETQSQILRILEPSFRAELDTAATAEPPSVSELIDRIVEEAEAAYADNPAVLGRQLATLGTVLFERGEMARADSLYARALALRRPLGREGDPVVHEAVFGRGLIARTDAPERALRWLREAVAMERAHPDLAEPESGAVVHLAGMLEDPDEREAALREILARRQAALPDTSIALALAHNELGVHLFNQAAFRGAHAEYRAAEAIVRRNWGELHPATNTLRSNLSYTSAALGRYADAERHARIALDAARRGGLGEAREALLRQAIGQALFFQHRLPEAERELRAALATFERAVGPSSPEALGVVNSLVVVVGEQRRFAEARALQARVAAAAAPDDLLGALYSRMMDAALRFAEGDRAAAGVLEDVLREMRALDDVPPMSRFGVLSMVGDARRAVGAPGRAVPLQREALAIAREAKGDASRNTVQARLALGRSLAEAGHLEAARPHLEAARGQIPSVAFPDPLDDVDAEIDRLLARGR
ncbi:protein kinase domain-containing protein [Rubrivirga sp. IMCC45206]|uniref:protein kinase domain-containing protein n=1 Tax=Rubrivirga sp. IMCC45206 TaxID=3391614 RepID=UPI0039900317